MFRVNFYSQESQNSASESKKPVFSFLLNIPAINKNTVEFIQTILNQKYTDYEIIILTSKNILEELNKELVAINANEHIKVIYSFEKASNTPMELFKKLSLHALGDVLCFVENTDKEMAFRSDFLETMAVKFATKNITACAVMPQKRKNNAWDWLMAIEETCILFSHLIFPRTNEKTMSREYSAGRHNVSSLFLYSPVILFDATFYFKEKLIEKQSSRYQFRLRLLSRLKTAEKKVEIFCTDMVEEKKLSLLTVATEIGSLAYTNKKIGIFILGNYVATVIFLIWYSWIGILLQLLLGMQLRILCSFICNKRGLLVLKYMFLSPLLYVLMPILLTYQTIVNRKSFR